MRGPATIKAEAGVASFLVATADSQTLVLKDDPNVLRLFFFAPKEDCIVRVMEHDGITGRDAENKIEKIDKHRADYYKYYTGKDWYDARNYDFCLDTTSMGYEKLVEVVKNFIEVYQS